MKQIVDKILAFLKPNKEQWYYPQLAAADSAVGWPAIPACPMRTFVHLMEDRARSHPEKLHLTRQEIEDAGLVEFRGRVFNEAAWGSEKIGQIEPPEWRAEYAWLYSIAMIDGTFIAEPKRLWADAYAINRCDWDAAKVARLLDEFERVGLLRRAQAEDGHVWGYWVGSERFAPTPERIKKARYKAGRRDLFS